MKAEPEKERDGYRCSFARDPGNLKRTLMAARKQGNKLFLEGD